MILRLLIPLTALCLLTAAAAPASRPGTSQRVDVRLSLAAPASTAHLCVDDDCHLVDVAGSQGAWVTLGLEYRLRDHLRTPSVLAEAGLPAVCRVRGAAGTVTRRPGVVIRITGAALRSLEADVKRDAEKLRTREHQLPSETQSTEVRLCLG